MGFWKTFFGIRSRELIDQVNIANGSESQSFQSDLKSVILKDSGYYDQEVVGESKRIDAFEFALGPRTDSGFDTEVIAEIFEDSANKFSDHAIGVKLEGNLVGYIPDLEARAMLAELDAINPDRLPVFCKAHVSGGWDRGNADVGNFGIRLSLSRPLRPIK